MASTTGVRLNEACFVSCAVSDREASGAVRLSVVPVGTVSAAIIVDSVYTVWPNHGMLELLLDRKEGASKTGEPRLIDRPSHAHAGNDQLL